MNKPKLFICEKPLMADKVSLLMEEGDVVILAQSISSYKFDYGKLLYKDSPYKDLNPIYKKNINYNSNIFNAVNWNNKAEKIICEKLREIEVSGDIKNSIDYLRTFSEIIFACDYDFTGLRGFDFKMSKFFNFGNDWQTLLKLNSIIVKVMKTLATDENSMINGFKNRCNMEGNDEISIIRNSYIKKDYFEYNYNLNSILFFNKCLKDIDKKIYDSDNILLTKNYIWALIKISKEELNESDLIKKMSLSDIGSVVSRSEILNNLSKFGLIIFLNDSKETVGTHVILTESGSALVKKFHKRLDDPFIGIRLSEDILSELSVSDFKSKYERYLYLTFSKQKRYLRKQNRI